MATVELRDVVKHYGGNPVVDTLSLSVCDGEFLTLLGPSGCGKTTCLRMIAGFVTPDGGSVHIGGSDVTHTPAYHRDTGMVFQQYALFPHLNVAQNLAFGLRIRKVKDREVKARVFAALSQVRLDGYEQRYPEQLSGGQKQRVALARALIIKPRVLLLDEPLGALDQKLREELQTEIKRIQRELGITTIFVTHDQAEAVSLSDRIVVMRNGGISQIGSPQTLYDRPADQYVASFIGKINLIKVRALGGVSAGSAPVASQDGVSRWHAHFDAQTPPFPGEPMLLALRPERLRLGDHLENRIAARVDNVTYAGDGWLLEVSTSLNASIDAPVGIDASTSIDLSARTSATTSAGTADSMRLLVKIHGRTAPGAGDQVTLCWEHDDATLLREEAAA